MLRQFKVASTATCSKWTQAFIEFMLSLTCGHRSLLSLLHRTISGNNGRSDTATTARALCIALAAHETGPWQSTLWQATGGVIAAPDLSLLLASRFVNEAVAFSISIRCLNRLRATSKVRATTVQVVPLSLRLSNTASPSGAKVGSTALRCKPKETRAVEAKDK